MIRKMLAILLTSLSTVWGQSRIIPDSGRVVVLSDRLGPVISREARDRYRIFPAITDFRTGTVLQVSDSTFIVHFITGKTTDRERDTAIVYSIATLRMLSEKVDNFDAVDEGTYRFGDHPANLRYADGTPVSFILASASLTPVQRPAPRVGLSGPLPLATDGGFPRERTFPILAVTIGTRSFRPDASGLTPAYGHDPSSLTMLFSLGFEILVSESFGLCAEGSATTGNAVKAEGWIGGTYYLVLPRAPIIRPFVSVGLALCSYENRDGPWTDAGASGFSVLAGTQFYFGGAGIELFGGYEFFPEQTATLTSPEPAYGSTGAHEVPVSMEFSGAVFGIRVKIMP